MKKALVKVTLKPCLNPSSVTKSDAARLVSRRIYGGGILSSPSETIYTLNGSDTLQQSNHQQQPQNQPEHRAFDLLDVLRTPYRIDHIQPIYYVIDDLDALFDIVDSDIMGKVKQAMALGLFEPTYAPKNS